MNDQQVGAVIRAIRRRRGWRQSDVAKIARIDQSKISLIERGLFHHLRLDDVRAATTALGIELPFAPRWRGPELAKLLDEHHSALVEWCVRELRDARWETIIEYSFNHFGDRGSVDVVGWHGGRSALILIEVKTRIVDVQDLLRSVDMKRRIVPPLLQRERRWTIRHQGHVVVIAESGTNRRAIERHRETFAAAFPQRSVQARRWIQDPTGDIAAIRFSPVMPHGHGRHGRGGPTRVRVPR